MTALNKKGVSRRVTRSEAPKAESFNGNVQFEKGTEYQLYDLVVSHFFGKDTFYESHDDRVKRLETLVNSVVAKGNLHFVANSIIHARHKMHMRSMPIVLAVYFAKALHDQGRQYPEMRKVIADVIARADQINDLYAVALSVFGSKNKVPMAIRRGVADAFNKFNEYEFAKYNTSAKVKFRDVLRIVHPKGSSEEQGALFKKIMEDALSTPYTWETELSANGQKAEGEKKTKSALWNELITSGKMGYMALLRNLRNMWEAPISSEAKQVVYDRLADPKQVAKSKQLPFRFVNALDNVSQFHDSKLNRAISRAVDASLGNLPRIGERIWVIVDCSGSMGGDPIKTATLFGAAIAKSNAEAHHAALTMFSDNAFHCSINTDEPVLTIRDNLAKKVVGGGTNLQAALEMKKDLGFEPDTVVVISDMQINSLTGGYYGYSSRTRTPANLGSIFKPDCIKLAINLQGYASTPLSEIDGWYQLSGWSDRLFDFIPALRDKLTVVELFSNKYHGLPEKAAKKVKIEEENSEEE